MVTKVLRQIRIEQWMCVLTRAILHGSEIQTVHAYKEP
jgi:hypothetical protein